MTVLAHALSPAQLVRLRAAEHAGAPFLAYSDPDGELHVEHLGDRERVTLGRGAENDVALPWDPLVSRAHAQLERVGGEWTLIDEGLSRNGSFVNGERVAGRVRLADRDVVRIGGTTVSFRTPGVADASTVVADAAAVVELTAAQRRVLVALCRPLAAGDAGGLPATNRQIATELFLSLAGVKSHMRALFASLGVDDALPQYGKRVELARRALTLGLVGPADLREEGPGPT